MFEHSRRELTLSYCIGASFNNTKTLMSTLEPIAAPLLLFVQVFANQAKTLGQCGEILDTKTTGTHNKLEGILQLRIPESSKMLLEGLFYSFSTLLTVVPARIVL